MRVMVRPFRVVCHSDMEDNHVAQIFLLVGREDVPVERNIRSASWLVGGVGRSGTDSPQSRLRIFPEVKFALPHCIAPELVIRHIESVGSMQ